MERRAVNRLVVHGVRAKHVLCLLLASLFRVRVHLGRRRHVKTLVSLDFCVVMNEGKRTVWIVLTFDNGRAVGLVTDDERKRTDSFFTIRLYDAQRMIGREQNPDRPRLLLAALWVLVAGEAVELFDELLGIRRRREPQL